VDRSYSGRGKQMASISHCMALSRQSWHSSLRTVMLSCVVVSLCYLAPTLEGALLRDPKAVWPLWPGCAILVTVLLLVPTRSWPPVTLAGFAGFILYDLRAGVQISSIGWFIGADTVQVLVTAIGLKYFFDGVPRLNSLNALAKYGIVAIVIAPCTAAFFSALGIPGPYLRSWEVAFLSEMLAFTTLTPTILVWLHEGSGWLQSPLSSHYEAAALMAGTVSVGYVALARSGQNTSPALLYSLMPFLLWSALRFRSLGISTSMLLVSFLSIWGLAHGRGPFATQGLSTSMWSLQLFLIVAAMPFMVLAALVEDRKQRQRILTKLSANLINAQENERARIARELHDDIVQRLALLTHRLGQLGQGSGNVDIALRGQIYELVKKTSEIASDVQSLSHQLHSSKLEYLGLEKTIASFAREFAQSQGVEIDFQAHDVPQHLPASVSLCLFRVLQEGLHNALKHSDVQHFEVRLWATARDIHLTVRDAGSGFDIGAATLGPGIGIISMQERLRIVQGRLSIKSRPNGGTLVYARVPRHFEGIETKP
jgi:signal transduction histidine kinase